MYKNERVVLIMKKAFTLAEVLITLAIIGVVAAISIPSVISNSQQQEFRTGLRKAVSVLNSAITMNMAIDGESPYDNADLMRYLMKHMSIIKSTSQLPYASVTLKNNGSYSINPDNGAFYTTDGIRFEFNNPGADIYNESVILHESGIPACAATNTMLGKANRPTCGGCGSYGLSSNTNNTEKRPCLITVDVNGDKKPTPANLDCTNSSCAVIYNIYKVPLPAEKKLRDIFSIIITEDRAIPFGVTAQKAMYQAQK